MSRACALPAYPTMFFRAARWPRQFAANHARDDNVGVRIGGARAHSQRFWHVTPLLRRRVLGLGKMRKKIPPFRLRRETIASANYVAFEILDDVKPSAERCSPIHPEVGERRM
jgi:hypothetical protein